MRHFMEPAAEWEKRTVRVLSAGSRLKKPETYGKKDPVPLNHMQIPWHACAGSQGISRAGLQEKASVIGRIGLMLLACGAGAWRIRRSMNRLAEQLGITCTANIGLLTIDYTCFDEENSVTRSLCLKSAGVNTDKLNRLEAFVRDFPRYRDMSGEALHTLLDGIEETRGLYSPVRLGLASALACGGFTFLLGGGLPEILCAFLGAGFGNYLRCRLTGRRYTLFLCVAASVALACGVYTAAIRLGELLFALSPRHEAGYICAMLFIIPGFPLITSGIDLAKQDMRSGLERLSYALNIILVATLTAWLAALLLHLDPGEFPALSLPPLLWLLLRLLAGFCGVFGFSMMFNSPTRLAVSAALIGAVANTLRLELVDLAAFPPAAAAFLGALASGMLASLLKRRLGYSRISVTVPSIVIMVPGLYLYRGVYDLGGLALAQAASWFACAALIILALPLGLIFARILTDREFRFCT